jgi:hypothetical protein
LKHSLIICLFISVISLTSVTQLSDAFSNESVQAGFCHHQEFDLGEHYDLFDPGSQSLFSIGKLLSSVDIVSGIGDETNGFPHFYTIRAPPV